MYMLKAQKRLQSIERQEEEERRMEEVQERLGALKIVRGAVSDEVRQDGPPGAKKKVKYVGSFKVYPPPGLTGRELQKAISGFVLDRVSTINPKKVANPISGTMIINRHGIRIYKDKELFMAYPLRKVSYCTAVPKNSLFAMVTRSILNQPADVVYCHTFGLSSPEHANETSHLMSEAFKIAFAHRTLRRSMERDKDNKGKKTKSPWDILKRKDKRKSVPTEVLGPTSSQSSNEGATSSAPSNPSRSSLVSPPPRTTVPSPCTQRSGSITSTGVTSVGLEAEIVSIEVQIERLESRLSSLSPTSDDALDLTIQLSGLEDTLQVKRQQLDTLLVMENSESELPPPPAYNALAPSIQPSQVPSYDDVIHQQLPYNPMGDNPGGYPMGGPIGGPTGGPMGNHRESLDDQLILEDATWYQAGLPRELVMDILHHQPPGSFMVRDSSTNPGCHALSIVAPNHQILHYLIIRNPDGFYIQGSNKYHPDLMSLILYHATYVDFLPSALLLGSSNPLAPLPPPFPGAAAGDDWMYNPASDDEMDDEEMQSHLSNLQFINP